MENTIENQKTFDLGFEFPMEGSNKLFRQETTPNSKSLTLNAFVLALPVVLLGIRRFVK